jgi:citrate synthase
MFDPALVNTASCSSAITFIDGDAGILRYRGYPIDQLARRSNFLEITHLLLYGALPTAHQMDTLAARIKEETCLPDNFNELINSFPSDAHPMRVLSSAVNGLAAFHQEALDPHDPDQADLSAIRLLAKMPIIAASILRRCRKEAFVAPNISLDSVEDFLRMSFGTNSEPYEVDRTISDALNQLFVLHADHEQNCSTSTVRLVGSSHADLFSCISAGIGALSGPLHGGANQAVIEMLEEIKASGGDVRAFVSRVKNREPGVKLMGFGHRVYKSYDPRAAIVKKTASDILSKMGHSDELLNLARELENIALSEDFFVERNLYPNVDFYTGLIYKAIGFPTPMFPVLFALGRLPGWIAQWQELVTDPTTKIGRPRQVYTGETRRDYVEVEQRG